MSSFGPESTGRGGGGADGATACVGASFFGSAVVDGVALALGRALADGADASVADGVAVGAIVADATGNGADTGGPAGAAFRGDRASMRTVTAAATIAATAAAPKTSNAVFGPEPDRAPGSVTDAVPPTVWCAGSVGAAYVGWLPSACASAALMCCTPGALIDAAGLATGA